MKLNPSLLGVLFIPLFVSSAPLASAADPEACSVSIALTNRLGNFRTWTNALETGVLREKGLEICQDDAILDLSDEEIADLSREEYFGLLRCKTEFKLEVLFYKKAPLTRNVTIFKSGKVVFRQDYPPSPYMQTSTRILRTIPTCEELQALAKKSEK
jgi:hypothetical protein